MNTEQLDKIVAENRSRMMGGLRAMDEAEAKVWLETGRKPEDEAPAEEPATEAAETAQPEQAAENPDQQPQVTENQEATTENQSNE